MIVRHKVELHLLPRGDVEGIVSLAAGFIPHCSEEDLVVALGGMCDEHGHTETAKTIFLLGLKQLPNSKASCVFSHLYRMHSHLYVLNDGLS